MLIGRSSDNDGIETGGIETGGIETGVIETGVKAMLISWRGDIATVVANESVLLGCSAEQASSSEKTIDEVDGFMLD